jgi:hypothetical protein
MTSEDLTHRAPERTGGKYNPFWDSKPELFSDIACLRIPYQPCIVLFGKLFTYKEIKKEVWIFPCHKPHKFLRGRD